MVPGHKPVRRGARLRGQEWGVGAMATIFNLLKPSRWLDDRFSNAPRPVKDREDPETGSAFLSERGMIVIACIVFCSFVWSIVFLWLFG